MARTVRAESGRARGPGHRRHAALRGAVATAFVSPGLRAGLGVVRSVTQLARQRPGVPPLGR
jgi:hypothetical protein